MTTHFAKFTVDVQVAYDPDVESTYDAQTRFLDTLQASGLHHAEITTGLVDEDNVLL